MTPTTADLVALLEAVQRERQEEQIDCPGGQCDDIYLSRSDAVCKCRNRLAPVDAALTLLRSGSLVLVPGEPTEEMARAGANTPKMKFINSQIATAQLRTGARFNDELGTEPSAIVECYRAMLAAAKGKP